MLVNTGKKQKENKMTNITAVAMPDGTAFKDKAVSVLLQANELTVTNDDQFSVAGNFLRGLKGFLKELDDTFDNSIRAASLAHKAALATKKNLAEPIEQAEIVVKAKLGVYRTEQERLKAAERLKLEQDAIRQAENEKVAQAADLEIIGKSEEANALLASHTVITPVVVPDLVKVDGVSFREKWNGEVIDLMALIKAVAAGTAAATLVQADLKTIRSYAEATRGAIEVPGVRFYSEKVVSGRV